MPTGFYVGFEPPSDLSMVSALRHACLPKTYVADEYPDIEGEYLGRGVYRQLTFDNELAAHGNTIQGIADELSFGYQFTPVRTPWFKSRVEAAFKAVNDIFLREMPGFVLGRGLARYDYDPARHGCVGLRHFLYLFHKWLIDVYCQHARPGEASPAERWAQGTSFWEPELVARSKDLDLLFGVTRTGTLDHRGVVFETLRYYSEDLHRMRLRRGHHQSVKVKIDPSNLGAVHIWEPVDKCWVRAEAVDPGYAKGMSLHRHKLNRKHAVQTYPEAEAENFRRAEIELQEMIAEALPMALSIRSNSLIARALGIGTQHVFNNLDADGRLGPLTGPFEGARLNPLARAQSDAGRREPPTPPLPEPPKRLQREIPKLAADASLVRRSQR